MGEEDHFETLLVLALFYESTLKIVDGVWWLDHNILLSTQCQSLVSVCLALGLGLSLRELGLRLDN